MATRLFRRSRLLRLLAALALVAASAGPPSSAAARDAGLDDHEIGTVLTAMLQELGLAPETAAQLAREHRAAVGDRLDHLADAGLVSVDQIVQLHRVVEEERFDEHVGALVDDARARRSAFRAATAAALAHLGIEWDGQAHLHEVLAANGLGPQELADAFTFLGLELPPAPDGTPSHDLAPPAQDPASGPAGGGPDESTTTTTPTTTTAPTPTTSPTTKPADEPLSPPPAVTTLPPKYEPAIVPESTFKPPEDEPREPTTSVDEPSPDKQET